MTTRSFHKVYWHAKRHHKEAVRHFHKTHRHARRLLKSQGLELDDLRNHTVRTVGLTTIAAGALAGPMYARTVQNDASLDPHEIQKALISHQVITALGGSGTNLSVESIPLQEQSTSGDAYGPDASFANKSGLFVQKVKRIAENPGQVLAPEQEQKIEQLIQESYGIPAKAELEGIRLNATHGVIAGEQHLPLYPGDKVENHTTDPTWYLSGMVPGLPSWGYFKDSKEKVTEEDRLTEQWYGVAQTFLSPGWKENTEKYYKWYNGRKMIFINEDTGQAVIIRIKDAGPSPLLKRHFGGSPEVMDKIGYGLTRKGPIYAFFVDDPENKVPLGPVTALGGAQ